MHYRLNLLYYVVVRQIFYFLREFVLSRTIAQLGEFHETMRMIFLVDRITR